MLTSALKRVDVGIYDAIQQAKSGKFQGGSDLLFDLKNNGVGVGKISPKVPAAFITEMNSSEQIVAARSSCRARARTCSAPAGRRT